MEGEAVDILLTGAHGQLGKELERKLTPCHSVFSFGKAELDITQKEQAEKIIMQIKPQLIIHAAAFTAVDQCEKDVKKAFDVNGLGAANIALAANKVNARMFYISSDYVFNGEKQTPYVETDEPDPKSVYGMSKWMGEKLVRNINDGTIIRTSWLYGHDGKNFVKTMLLLAEKHSEIKVVNDQLGSPTYVNDLAEIIIQLIHKKNGIYHVSNTGTCTWYEFAKAIFKEAGYNPALVLPTTTEKFRAAAPRPRFSVLQHDALMRENVITPRVWNDALKEFMRKEKN
jgi:dTDP-4-dehydrorhamnose reductase